MATQKEVAAHLALSQPAVSDLVRSGIIKRSIGRGGYSLDDCRTAYIRHLREVAAGRSAGDPDAPNLVLERARLARAQADAQERKNLEADGQLIDMDLAGEVFFETARQSRDAWTNWPSRVAPLLAAELQLPIATLLAGLEEHVHRQLVALGDPTFADEFEQRSN